MTRVYLTYPAYISNIELFKIADKVCYDYARPLSEIVVVVEEERDGVVVV